jgi:hypothetical protein
MRLTGNSDEMDVDTAIGSSLSAGKRKHSDILLHGDDDDDHRDSDSSFHLNNAPLSNSHSLLVPSVSSAPSAPSVPSASSISLHNSVNPLKKKKTALTHISSLAMAPSGNIAMKITPAIVLHGMQRTLNRLTDIMEQKISLGSSPSSPRQGDSMSLRTRAIMLLQTRNDNLSTSEKMKLIHKFTKDIELAKVYVALEDDELRHNWLQDVLMLRDLVLQLFSNFIPYFTFTLHLFLFLF